MQEREVLLLAFVETVLHVHLLLLYLDDAVHLSSLRVSGGPGCALRYMVQVSPPARCALEELLGIADQ